MAEYPSATEEQIKEGKGIAWLSYWGIFFLIPLLAHKDNPYSRWHAVQGLTLCIAEVIWVILWIILGAIIGAIGGPFTVGGRICGTIWTIIGIVGVWILLLIAIIIGIIKAATGKFWKIWVIGDWGASIFKGLIPGGQ
ncbi:hypothetical protein JXM67_11585 [candidate division WOR-3 bacterium]|nr:hypothetical protein [candidate division WOR-3 bacterium]